MIAVMNAVASAMQGYLDAQVAAVKALGEKAPEIITTCTTAVDEITAALERSALPAAVRRAKEIQGEYAAALMPHMEAIQAAGGPLDASMTRLKERWNALTKTASESDETDSDETDSDETGSDEAETAHREALDALEDSVSKLDWLHPVRKEARSLNDRLSWRLMTRPLTREELTSISEMAAKVASALETEALRGAHEKRVRALYEAAVAVDDFNVYRAVSQVSTDLSNVCYVYKTGARPLNESELARLVEAEETARAAKFPRESVSAAALHRTY